MNLPLGGTQKLMKPFANNQSTKLFGKCSSSQYNSQKNLRNNATMGNNRYSSQNMKSFEYDDELDEEFGLEVAEENLPIYNNITTNQRRTSQRFKDRVRSIRVQSQETCQREGNLGACKSEGSNEPFEIFERAPIDSLERIQSKNNQKSNFININPCEVDQSQGKGWTQPISIDEEETPKVGDDDSNGPHFQFNELLNKLKEIKKVKKDQQQSSQRGKKSLKKVKNNDTLELQRQPLKEKNLESVNQQQNLLSDFKKKKSLDNKQKRNTLTNTGSGRPSNKQGIKVQQSKQQVPQQQNEKNRLSRLILTNQENNFIEKKLKDQDKEEQPVLTKQHKNKSQANLHKSSENSKSNLQSQGAVINNMKGRPQSNNNIIVDIQQKQSFCSQNSNKGNAQKIPQIPQLNTHVNGQGTNNHQQKIGSFGKGIKCPSANVLKTGNTAISSNRKSTIMTQSSSNKQFQTKDTPEATQRQKIRLGVATSLSSNSKMAAATTSSGSNNGQSNFIPSNFQTTAMQHESITKGSQNSDSKHSKQESICNRSISNTTQKTEIKKMMIKNQNLLKKSSKVLNQHNKNQNEFYQTIFQKISSNSNFFVPTSQMLNNNSGITNKRESGPSQVEKKKNPAAGGSARVQKIHTKVSNQRFSGQGNNQVNSPGTMDIKSLESSPSQSWTRRSSVTGKDNQQPQKQGAPQNQNPMTMYQVNQILRKLQDQTQPLVKSQKPTTTTNIPSQQSILLQHQLKKNTMNQINKHAKVNKFQNEMYLNRNNSQESMFKNFQISGKNSDNQLIKTLEIDKKTLQEQFSEDIPLKEAMCLGQKHVPVNQNEKRADLVGKFLQQKKQEQNNHQKFLNSSKNNIPGGGSKKGLLIQNIMLQNGVKNKTRQSEKVYMQTQDQINEDVINVGDVVKFTSLMHEEDEILPQSSQRLSGRAMVKGKN